MRLRIKKFSGSLQEDIGSSVTLAIFRRPFLGENAKPQNGFEFRLVWPKIYCLARFDFKCAMYSLWSPYSMAGDLVTGRTQWVRSRVPFQHRLPAHQPEISGSYWMTPFRLFNDQVSRIFSKTSLRNPIHTSVYNWFSWTEWSPSSEPEFLWWGCYF